MVAVHGWGKPAAGQPQGVALTGRGSEGEMPLLQEKCEQLQSTVAVHGWVKPAAGQPQEVALTGRGSEGEMPLLQEKCEQLPSTVHLTLISHRDTISEVCRGSSAVEQTAHNR